MTELIYEIINPSDQAFIKASDVKVAQAAGLVLGRGNYGLTDLGGETVLPILIFGAKEFIQETFGGQDEMLAYLSEHNLEIAECLDTCYLSGERSSLNNIVRAAKSLAKGMRQMQVEKDMDKKVEL